MTMISYAQNFEDVILLRVLGGVSRGFYIDVGAQHPIHGSVTNAFYELGWRGINIEPVAQWFDELVKERPKDVNLRVAISDTEKELALYEVADTGLSTTTARYAERHQQEGRAVTRHTVACRTLDDVIADYDVGDIHLLKVDVEGAEGSVLKSISLNRHRPWVMVIEATEPNSQRPSYKDWEPRILASGYEMVYEDGLNRFYLAEERADLKDAFRLPPNYFDDFILYSDWCIKKELEARTHELEASKVSARASSEGAEVGALRQRLFQQRALYRLASREKRKLREERDELIKAVAHATAEFGVLQKERGQFAEAVAHASVELGALQAERDELVEAARHATAEFGVLQTERDQLTEAAVCASAELRALQMERSELIDATAHAAAEFHLLQVKHDELATLLEQTSQTLHGTNVELKRVTPYERAAFVAESELGLIKSSRSWRLTRPLRSIRPVARSTRDGTRKALRAVCVHAAHFLVTIPGARPVARGALGGSPALKQRVLNLMYGPQQVSTDSQPVDARAVVVSADNAVGTKDKSSHPSFGGLPTVGAGTPVAQHGELSRSASEALALLRQDYDLEQSANQDSAPQRND